MSKYEDRKIKLPDRAELEEALQEALDVARSEGSHVALAGGVAMQLLGSPRLTKDVDFVADLELRGLTEVGRLVFDGVDGGQSLLASNGVEVDVIVRRDDYRDLYDKALNNADLVLGIPVLTPEYLAATKYASGRARDQDDLDFLIAERLCDEEKVGVILRRHLGHHTVREWRYFVEESKFRTKRGRR